MSPTRTGAVLAVIAAVVCVALGMFQSVDSVAAVDHGAVSTPLWSPRRVPQPIVDAVGSQHLQVALDAQLGGVSACFVVEEGGAPLATHAADVPLIPASTLKLVTAAAALSVLGPDARLETRAVAVAAPQDGIVDRLYLVGGGDPLLMTPDVQALREETPALRGTPTTSLAALADSIVAAGVQRIPGGIGADDTRYDSLRYLPTWDVDYRTEGQIGPVGALTVNGGFSQLRPTPVPVDDPAVFAAEKLGELLEARGVHVGRAPSREAAPAGAVEIAKVQSPPITDVIAEDLSTSDNLGSELLTREIGLHVARQGTTAAGTQSIAAKLAELGLPMTNVTLVDGSGLDKANRATCALLAATLDLGARAEFSVLWSGLAVAGERGTLVDQIGGALTGKVRGKTGTVDGATGLVGIVDVGRPVRFAFLANGSFTQQGGIGLRTRIAGIIATFPDAPPADTLVPRPAPGAAGSEP
jgi:D-alanyl-D-alanine carboxypeptidase/D-alanyl-D-alanine-endopeptidase (penicillin-binding protein 4)